MPCLHFGVSGRAEYHRSLSSWSLCGVVGLGCRRGTPTAVPRFYLAELLVGELLVCPASGSCCVRCSRAVRAIRVGSFRTTGLQGHRYTASLKNLNVVGQYWSMLDTLLRVLLHPKCIISQGNLGGLLRENLDNSERCAAIRSRCL